jgi:hypothetical protein
MNPVVSPQYAEVIKSLEKFGFKFFGYAENKEPLLAAPNGQIVPLNVAYNFVKTKLVEPSGGGAGPESMPVAPIMPETFSETPNEAIDTKIEVQKGMEAEKKVERAPLATEKQTDLQVQKIAPKIAVVAPKIDIPFGDGFYPRAFDPVDVSKAQQFVTKHAQKDDKTTEKWLAVMWDKFLRELGE